MQINAQLKHNIWVVHIIIIRIIQHRALGIILYFVTMFHNEIQCTIKAEYLGRSHHHHHPYTYHDMSSIIMITSMINDHYDEEHHHDRDTSQVGSSAERCPAPQLPQGIVT